MPDVNNPVRHMPIDQTQMWEPVVQLRACAVPTHDAAMVLILPDGSTQTMPLAVALGWSGKILHAAAEIEARRLTEIAGAEVAP